jgi:hypothetical protein
MLFQCLKPQEIIVSCVYSSDTFHRCGCQAYLVQRFLLIGSYSVLVVKHLLPPLVLGEGSFY